MKRKQSEVSGAGVVSQSVARVGPLAYARCLSFALRNEESPFVICLYVGKIKASGLFKTKLYLRQRVGDLLLSSLMFTCSPGREGLSPQGSARWSLKK